MISSVSEWFQERIESLDKKTIAITAAIGTAIVAMVGTGAYFSPYLTLQSMKNATINRNAEGLAAEIDFPALRANIKNNVRDRVLKQASNNRDAAAKTNPELVDKIVGPMVDKIVSPEGLEQLMLDKFPTVKIDLSNLEKDMAKSNIDMGYESFDRFLVKIADKTDPSKNVTLTLKRNGLFWKLSGIDLSQV
jgi:Protein of unknown function (DUF2939)